MPILFTIYGLEMNDGVTTSFARDVYVDKYPDDTDEDVRERAMNALTEEMGADIIVHTMETDEV